MINHPRIVVGVGNIDDGVRPLSWAVDEARRRGADLHAVRVWRDRNQPGQLTDYWRHQLAEAAQETLIGAFSVAVGTVPRDITTRLVMREGTIAEALLEYADHADDLLVLGASSRSRFWPFGDGVVRRCVQKAVCPVVVVPQAALTRAIPMRKLLRDLRREIEEFERSST